MHYNQGYAKMKFDADQQIKYALPTNIFLQRYILIKTQRLIKSSSTSKKSFCDGNQLTAKQPFRKTNKQTNKKPGLFAGLPFQTFTDIFDTFVKFS